MSAVQYIHISMEIWGAVFCLIAAVCVHVTRRFDERVAGSLCCLLLTDAVLNLNEALAYYFRGNVTRTGYFMVRITNFTVFVCGYLLALFACRYLGQILERQGGKTGRRWDYVVYVFCGLGILLLVLSRIFGFYYAFDEQNRYYRLDGSYWLMNTLGLLPVVLLYIRIIRSRKRFQPLQYISFLVFIFLPVAGFVIQTFHYGISVYNITNTVCIMFFFITYEMDYARYMVEQERKIGEEREQLLRERIAVEKEKVRFLEKQVEVDRERIHLYHSQIQPHFIYNSLTAVMSWLPPDSKAGEVLAHFTGFLRGSIDMLTETECIPAKREYATVEHYLYMEKERYGDDVTVETDMQDLGFLLPTFTIQSLVENAINHGIRKRQDGRGVLSIRSRQTAEEHIIEVQDNGVGFDTALLVEESGNLPVPSGQENSQQAHIGLKNLKKRLEMMCGGTLEIESTVGVGTLARVRIPKEWTAGKKL